MAILIIAILVSGISIYGALTMKRFFFLLGYFLFSILAVTSLLPSFGNDKLLAITTMALMVVLAIISFPARKNILDYKINDEAKPLLKSFAVKNLLALSAINFFAVFIVLYDTNMPEGMTENMRSIPMVMHGILGVLPVYVMFNIIRSNSSN